MKTLREKGGNVGNQHFLLFNTMFYAITKANFNYLITTNLSPANTFNLDKYIIFSFDQELKLFCNIIRTYTCTKQCQSAT